MKIEENMDLNQVTEKIIGCAYKVSNELGSGFLEKVYENALAYELRKDGLHVLQQHPMQVQYDGVVVGEYYADLLVEDCVMVELKTVKALDEVHMAQCLNYLKATGLHLCLLINFYRPKVEIKRIVHRLEGTVNKAVGKEPLMAF
jgi:GxxExxY protein